MAGATAFFAFFALPPIVIIVSQVLSVLFNDYQQAVSGRLFYQLSDLFGYRSARQLQDISQHLQPQKADDWLTTVIVIILLLIASTTMFEVMKNSLNQLWNVKNRAKQTPVQLLRNRGIALVIIIVSGLLFTASIAVDRLLFSSSSAASPSVETTQPLITAIGRYVTSVLTLTCWFALLFKFLPNIRIRWSAVWIGALVTSVLFTIGEMVLTSLLTAQQMQSVHGRAGAITLVLLLVFYCSLLFYYGASFTRQYAHWAKGTVVPTNNAVSYQITEVDKPEA